MKKPESPCQGCRDRRTACHDACEKFRQFKIEQKKWADEIIRSKNDQYRSYRGSFARGQK